MQRLASDYRIGVLSDTHGLLRPEVVNALKGVDRIIHAGDLDTPELLGALKKIAPVTAVKGNMDHGGWARHLHKTEVVEVGNHLFYVLHEIHGLDVDPKTAGFSAIIFGHSHMHSLTRENGILYLNPGGAGYRRFNYPISLAILSVREDRIEPAVIELEA